MKIGFLGDLHQSAGPARFAMWTFNQLGVETVHQVGDYGLGNSRRALNFQKRIDKAAELFGITLMVTLGNHENWEQAQAIFGDDRNTCEWIGPNVALLPRGYRWEQGGMSFVSLGGAPSVDRMYRLALKQNVMDDPYWCAGEQITQADVDYVTAGGYADVMIAHDAPHGVNEIERLIGGNPHGFHPADILYAEDGRKLMTEAFRGVAPKLFVHGHYHFKVDERIQRPGGEYGLDTTHILGLDCEYHNWSMAVLDTETGEAQHIDHTGHLFRYQKEFG